MRLAIDRLWHKLPVDASRNGRSTPKADQGVLAILHHLRHGRSRAETRPRTPQSVELDWTS